MTDDKRGVLRIQAPPFKGSKTVARVLVSHALGAAVAMNGRVTPALEFWVASAHCCISD